MDKANILLLPVFMLLVLDGFKYLICCVSDRPAIANNR